MTNADWWARVLKARMEREDLLPRKVWALPAPPTRPTAASSPPAPCHSQLGRLRQEDHEDQSKTRSLVQEDLVVRQLPPHQPCPIGSSFP